MPEEFRFEERPKGTFEVGQRLLISGTHDGLEEAMRQLRGHVAPQWVIDRISREARARADDIQVVEMVVTADSRIIGRTLATSGIADNYGVAVMGIHKPDRLLGQRATVDRQEIRFAEGDVVLATGLAEELTAFASGDGLLQLEGAKIVPRRSKANLAAGIMLGSVIIAAVGLLPIAIAALGGAILMFLTGCVKFDRVGRGLSASVIVLVAASISIGRIILDSGAAAWLGETMAMGLQYLPAAVVLAAVMLFVTVLTNFASNATAATVGTPIAFSLATELGLPQEPHGAGGAVRLQSVLRDAHRLPNQHADHGRGWVQFRKLHQDRRAAGDADGGDAERAAGDVLRYLAFAYHRPPGVNHACGNAYVQRTYAVGTDGAWL